MKTALSPEQRLIEVAAILAAGIVRLRLCARPPDRLRELRNQRNPLRIALRFPPKRGSVSTRVDGFGDLTRSKTMHLNVAKEVAALRKLTMRELRGRYAEVFGETTNANNKAWLIKRIAWRLQAMAEGDLSERARRAGRGAGQRRRPAADAAEPKETPAAEERTRIGPIAVEQRGPPAAARHGHHPQVQGRDAAGEGAGRRLRVRGRGLQSLTRRRQGDHRQHCNGFLFFKLTKEVAS